MMTVEDILSNKSIPYRISGADYLVRCFNPEHEDRNPSMRVDRITGIFNCLSCGHKGNLFTESGETPNWLQIRRNKLKNSISTKMTELTGLVMPTSAVPFSGQYRDISLDTMRKFGAFTTISEELVGHIVFPLRMASGKIKAFCGARVDGGSGFRVGPKYIFYPKDCKIPLSPIVKPYRGHIILVEGIYDMLKLQDNGFSHTVCNFGLKKPTKEQMNLFRIQGVDCIDLFLDSDEAGLKATEEIKKLLEDNEFSTRILTTQDYKDPGEMTPLQLSKLKEKIYENSNSGDKT